MHNKTFGKKEYDHEYNFAGSYSSCGQMLCAVCVERVDSLTQDWVATKRSLPGFDWEYLTRHRDCTEDQSGWELIDKQKADREAKIIEYTRWFELQMDDEGELPDELFEAMGRLGLEVS